ncbi:uncharacterized protein LOC144106870 [Amblyomma americanum]
MQLIFVLFLCAVITCLAVADEADDVKELIEKTIREHAGSEELSRHIHARVQIFEDCTSKHPEEEAALLRKMVLPVVTGGTKCASAKIDTADHAEKVQAVKKCFRETDKRVKEAAGLTKEEAVAYDEIKPCFYANLKEVDV